MGGIRCVDVFSYYRIYSLTHALRVNPLLYPCWAYPHQGPPLPLEQPNFPCSKGTTILEVLDSPTG